MKRKSNGRAIAVILTAAILFSLMSILTGCQGASPSENTSMTDVPETDISSTDTSINKQEEPKSNDDAFDKEREVMTAEEKELYKKGFEFGEEICFVCEEALTLSLFEKVPEEQYEDLLELRKKIFYESAEDREALNKHIKELNKFIKEELDENMCIEVPEEFGLEGFMDADIFYTSLDIVLLISVNGDISEEQYAEFALKAIELRADISPENVIELLQYADVLIDKAIRNQLDSKDSDQSTAGEFI